MQKEYLDDFIVYSFIRQDVEVKHQIVQFGHAMRQMATDHALANAHQPEKLIGVPFLTTVGMPDKKGMDKVAAKLSAAGYKFTAFHDTDYEFGIIGLVTEPMPLAVREKPDGFMCNYRLWNPANNTGADKPQSMVGAV